MVQVYEMLYSVHTYVLYFWSTRDLLLIFYMWMKKNLKVILKILTTMFCCVVDADNLRRRCPWFHQSAEKQVQVQTLLQEAPPSGVPASPDRARGRRPRQVRTTLGQSDLDFYLP